MTLVAVRSPASYIAPCQQPLLPYTFNIRFGRKMESDGPSFFFDGIAASPPPENHYRVRITFDLIYGESNNFPLWALLV